MSLHTRAARLHTLAQENIKEKRVEMCSITAIIQFLAVKIK
jgi:hypothetical protein